MTKTPANPYDAGQDHTRPVDEYATQKTPRTDKVAYRRYGHLTDEVEAEDMRKLERELAASQKAYTAAHSKLERAVADLAACREVADGLRENATLPYIVEYTMRGYDEWKPVAAFDGKTAADQYATGYRSANWDYRVVDAAPSPDALLAAELHGMEKAAEMCDKSGAEMNERIDEQGTTQHGRIVFSARSREAASNAVAIRAEAERLRSRDDIPESKQGG